MNPREFTMQATLQPDGRTLQLDEKIGLAPGRVSVTVQAARPKSGPTMLEELDRIVKDRREQGRPSITEDAMAREINDLRSEDDEADQRWHQIWSQTTTTLPSSEAP
jgi:hypothetical protein